MKNSIRLLIFFFIFISLPIILESCSSIYSVKDFSSKEKLYQDFNNSVNDKSINVKFINDSSLTINNGAVIKNDTLYTIGYRLDKKYGKIALPEIKKINYTGSDYKSATLLLKNDEQINAGDINIANDTMEYSVTKKMLVRTEVAPLDKIKEASYKNRWLGIPPRFLIGTATGVVLGFIIASAIDDGTQGGQSRSGYFFVGSLPIGALVGIIWGWIDGYNYIYQFNR